MSAVDVLKPAIDFLAAHPLPWTFAPSSCKPLDAVGRQVWPVDDLWLETLVKHANNIYAAVVNKEKSFVGPGPVTVTQNANKLYNIYCAGKFAGGFFNENNVDIYVALLNLQYAYGKYPSFVELLVKYPLPWTFDNQEVKDVAGHVLLTKPIFSPLSRDLLSHVSVWAQNPAEKPTTWFYPAGWRLSGTDNLQVRDGNMNSIAYPGYQTDASAAAWRDVITLTSAAAKELAAAETLPIETPPVPSPAFSLRLMTTHPLPWTVCLDANCRNCLLDGNKNVILPDLAYYTNGKCTLDAVQVAYTVAAGDAVKFVAALTRRCPLPWTLKDGRLRDSSDHLLSYPNGEEVAMFQELFEDVQAAAALAAATTEPNKEDQMAEVKQQTRKVFEKYPLPWTKVGEQLKDAAGKLLIKRITLNESTYVIIEALATGTSVDSPEAWAKRLAEKYPPPWDITATHVISESRVKDGNGHEMAYPIGDETLAIDVIALAYEDVCRILYVDKETGKPLTVSKRDTPVVGAHNVFFGKHPLPWVIEFKGGSVFVNDGNGTAFPNADWTATKLAHLRELHKYYTGSFLKINGDWSPSFRIEPYTLNPATDLPWRTSPLDSYGDMRVWLAHMASDSEGFTTLKPDHPLLKLAALAYENYVFANRPVRNQPAPETPVPNVKVPTVAEHVQDLLTQSVGCCRTIYVDSDLVKAFPAVVVQSANPVDKLKAKFGSAAELKEKFLAIDAAVAANFGNPDSSLGPCAEINAEVLTKLGTFARELVEGVTEVLED